MLKKISLIVLFTTILVISTLSLPAQRASASIYINVTPKEQTITNARATAYWDVSWGGGQSEYTLAYRRHSDQKYRTLVSKTHNTYKRVSQTYDLGAAASKSWKPSFRVIDYWGLFAVEEVTVYHYRIR